MSYFEEADEELLDLAREVIREIHPDLLSARFGFAYRSDAAKRKGAKVLAAVSMVSRRVQVHVDLDYLVWVARPDWDRMPLEQRKALLDHEFCHCTQGEGGEWGTRDHDVQEFVAIIKRHGLWRPDLRRLGKAVQECLPGLEPLAPEGAIVAAPALAMAQQLE